MMYSVVCGKDAVYDTRGGSMVDLAAPRLGQIHHDLDRDLDHL